MLNAEYWTRKLNTECRIPNKEVEHRTRNTNCEWSMSIRGSYSKFNVKYSHSLFDIRHWRFWSLFDIRCSKFTDGRVPMPYYTGENPVGHELVLYLYKGELIGHIAANYSNELGAFRFGVETSLMKSGPPNNRWSYAAVVFDILHYFCNSAFAITSKFNVKYPHSLFDIRHWRFWSLFDIRHWRFWSLFDIRHSKFTRICSLIIFHLSLIVGSTPWCHQEWIKRESGTRFQIRSCPRNCILYIIRCHLWSLFPPLAWLGRP